MRRSWLLLLPFVVLLARAPNASAYVLEGSPAPNFTKNQLDAPPPAARTLASYSGKVLVIFLMGCT